MPHEKNIDNKNEDRKKKMKIKCRTEYGQNSQLKICRRKGSSRWDKKAKEKTCTVFTSFRINTNTTHEIYQRQQTKVLEKMVYWK